MVVKTVWFVSLELIVTSPVPPVTRVASKKQLHAGVGVTRQGALPSASLVMKFAGGDQADAELPGRLQEGVGDGGYVSGLDVGE